MPSKHILANREANSHRTYDLTIWLSLTTDNSNIFIRSREVRDNESQMYVNMYQQTLIKSTDWLKIRSGRGILIYLTGQGLMFEVL